MDFLEEEFNEILNIFQIESDEIISRLNNNLLDLEKKPSNKDAILMLFRDAHSLKGAARMIGFNNVQTIAHKIEDILGLAKENKIQLNSKIIDILYKTVDFLSTLISKSISQKKEYYSESITEQIALLDNIEQFADETYSKDDAIEFNLELLKQNLSNINYNISKALATLMQIEIEKDEFFIDELLSTVNELYKIFKEIDVFDIKKGFEDISVKLDFVIKGSHNLTPTENEEIQQILNNIITSLISICEIHNLEVVDYYEEAFEMGFSAKKMPEYYKAEKNSTTIEESIIQTVVKDAEVEKSAAEVEDSPTAEGFKIEEEPMFQSSIDKVVEVVSDAESIFLEKVQEKLLTLSQHPEVVIEIKRTLEEFKSQLQNDLIEQVLSLIIKILEYTEQNQITLEEDVILSLNQGIEYCDSVLKQKEETVDRELIIQRLEIMQQVLSLNTQQSEDFMPPLSQNALAKNETFSDFSKIFDTGEIKTLRVDSSKLDTLVNQVGELIVAKIKTKNHINEIKEINKDLEEGQRNALKALNYLKYYEKKYFAQFETSDNPVSFFIKQIMSLFSDNNKKYGEAINNISTLQRTIQEDDMKANLIVDDLERLVKNIRVLPLATIFHLFGRMVRDIAQEKNKKIELEIIGSETSTDKKIIEEIKTPLIHMIRNAIDHGIETPEERIALGKPPEGKIVLRARQVESNVIIEIQDDGKGVNVQKIKEKAIHKGYLSEEEANSMSNEQLTNLIFTPGFSTEDEITNISGRGIGLDVVQTKISQLNGKVKIISEVNKGCCVQIELPTTMSTLKAFLVKSSNQTFAIPMSAINTVVWKKHDEIISNQDNRSIIFNEKTIPVYKLSEILNLPKQEIVEVSSRETVLIIEGENKNFGLAVDKLIGDQEIIQKKLSAPIYRLKNISGVTTLISGEICLILNISDLLKTLANPMVIKSQSPYQVGTLKKKNEEYKILLVDDSITTRTLEKNILTKAGYRIEIATNPIEAFEMMKTDRFDLIISDVEMPRMDGFEFLKALKADEMYFEIPVIIVSSLVSDENKKRSKELGASGYIVKGEFDQNEFLDTVSKILM